MKLNGTVVGYDPGGNSIQCLAIFCYREGNLIDFKNTCA